MSKDWFQVKANAEKKSVQVAIRGYIGEWGANDTDLARQIEAAGEVEDIYVSINSRGGEVDIAMGIMNTLRNHPAKVHVRIDGMAASAASIIAMAGDEIVMPSNTLMMVHMPRGHAHGTSKQLKKAGEDMEKFDAILLEVYKARTGKDEDELVEMLEAESFLTAEQAVEMGFADRVEKLERTAMVAIAEAMEIPEAVLDHLRSLEASGQEPTPTDDAANKAAEGGEPNKDTLPDQAAAAADPAVVAELCNQHNVPQIAPDLIRAKATRAAVAERILEIKAAMDEGRITDPHHPLPAGPDPAAITSSWESAFSTVRN